MSSITSRIRRTAFIAGAGAAAAYFLDPEQGVLRRDRFAARVRSMVGPRDEVAPPATLTTPPLRAEHSPPVSADPTGGAVPITDPDERAMGIDRTSPTTPSTA